eukprot:11192969-Lingulodinium_polyedra.AAC.1
MAQDAGIPLGKGGGMASPTLVGATGAGTGLTGGCMGGPGRVFGTPYSRAHGNVGGNGPATK